MRSLSVAAPHAARGGDLPHPGERWPTSASDGKPIGAGNKPHFAMLGNCAATIALGNKFPKLVDPRALAPAVAEAIGSFVLTVTSVSWPGRTTSNRQKPSPVLSQDSRYVGPAWRVSMLRSSGCSICIIALARPPGSKIAYSSAMRVR
jgi:hypothetical protein